MSKRTTLFGVLAAAGAAVGAAATYMFMKPDLRKELMKKGMTRASWDAVKRSVREDMNSLSDNAKELTEYHRGRSRRFFFRFGKAADEVAEKAEDLKEIANTAKDKALEKGRK